MSRIFISHSSANNAAALGISQWLKENGWDDYFLDINPSRGLAPGERWQEALRAAADRCEAVVFLISPAWRESRWCLAEFLLAKQLGKTIFGALVEPTPLVTLPPEMTTEWQLCDLVAGDERRTFQVHFDPIVAKTMVSFAEPGLNRLKLGLKKAGLDPSTFPWPPPSDPERSPYRGLRALDAEDAAVFFGREADIVRGLDKLRGLREGGVERLFVILGASGAGKSSFLRAGLWPRLNRDDRHFVPLPVIRPERAVISGPTGLAASLERALRERNQAKNRAEIRTVLAEPDGFHGLITELQSLSHSLEPDAALPTILLLIDQGEELYIGEGRAEAEAFLTLLGQALAAPKGEGEKAIAERKQTLALIAIRSDSYDHLQAEPRLESVKPALFDLRPVPHSAFKAVIEGPAQCATAAGRRLTIQPELTEKLLNDAEGADALPLLAFTLERLFVEHGGDGDLRLDEYEALGGVRGSIETAVAAAFAEPGREPAIPADAAERNHCLRLGFVPWLARIDPDTEERKRRVARWEEIPPESRPLLERLIEQRLLIRDQRKSGEREVIVVEVAHEALLRQWPTLTVWLDEDVQALKAADAVQRAASEWKRNNEGEAWLVHTGERLEKAEELRQRTDFDRLMGADSRAYLQACRARDDAARAERVANLKRIEEEQLRVAEQQRHTARAQRRAKVLLAMIAFFVLGAGSWIVFQAREVSRQISLVLATDAQTANDAGFHDRAMRLAVVAARESWLAPSAPEAEPQLVRAAHASLFMAQIEGHERRISTAALSPDGTRIVTASEDKTARVWDLETGKHIAELKGHEARVSSAAFSPDGKQVVTASSDQTARIWDVEKASQIGKLAGHESTVFAAAFTRDGKQILTASSDRTVRVWDAERQVEISRFTGPEDVSFAPTFSPDGHKALTVSAKKGAWKVSVWDIEKKEEIVHLATPEGVSLAAFSPNAKDVVTASGGTTARVWEVEKGKQIAEFVVRASNISAARFSPDGKRVVTGSWDQTARVWDIATGEEIAQLKGHEGFVDNALFSPDGKKIVTTSGRAVRVWHVEREIKALKGHESVVSRARFSPDGQWVVTASLDETARLWKAETGNEIGQLKGHEDWVSAAAFSPDGKQIVTASRDKTARLWDVQTRKEIARFVHDDEVRSADFSPDGKRLLTTANDKSARVWDIETRRETSRLEGHAQVIVSARFNADGQRVVTGADDGTARVWDIEAAKPIALLDTDRGWSNVFASTFSRDGSRAVTASGEKSVSVWDIATQKEIPGLKGRQDIMFVSAFSPDGKRIVRSNVGDNTVLVWDLATESKIAELKGHADWVSDAAFSPDGKRVVTTSGDRTARTWNVEWLTGYHGLELIEAVCREKLQGARILTEADVNASPLLRNRQGEDVCAPPTLLRRILTRLESLRFN